MQWPRSMTVAMVLTAALALGGCASMPAGSTRVAHDPFEPFNRSVFAVNDTFDRYFLRPIARTYVDYVHEGIRGTIGNVYGNVADVWTSVNQLLQGKPRDAVSDFSRFLINTTFGFLGVADVASAMGFEKHREDLGQTLGVWGLGSGPYLVLPFFGPSSVRDGSGFAVDFTVDPIARIDDVAARNSVSSLRAVDTRAGLFPGEKLLEGAALDRYSFIRDGYLQRRRNLVYDGNPPQSKE